jgi:pilus assembly protein CpaB
VLKNKKVLIVAGVALAAAILTTVFFGAVLSDQFSAQQEVPQVVVAAAARDLPRGTRLASEDIELTKRDVSAVPFGAAMSSEELEGRFLIQSVRAGEPIVQSHLPSRESGGMAATIPPGMRAVSLHVEEYAGVTEIVEPGDRVDILVGSNRRAPGQAGIDVATLLENIEVIDTGRRPDQPGRQTPPPVVTVIVDSEHAQALSRADQSGAIRLTLRNPTDGNLSIQASGPAVVAAQ